MTPAPLSTLVEYANRLDSLELEMMRTQIQGQFAAATHCVSNDPGVGMKKMQARLDSAQQQIEHSIDQYVQLVREIRQQVQVTVDAHHALYLKESSRLFRDEMCWETTEYILNRKLNISDQDQELLLGKILRYNDWRVPGLILRPGRETWIDHLVALDPLYLADTATELLEPAVQRYSPEYQRRLRCYVLQERTDAEIMVQLPAGQFGYVFAYNFFNYKPIELVKRYLQELWTRLRSGGVLWFSFNDCDYSHGVALTEQHFMCYTPASMLIDAAEKIGFETVHRHHGQADLAWLELRKPGKMRSMKGAQTLATIMLRSK